MFQAHRSLIGHDPQRGLAAVQTRAPSSITATAQVAGCSSGTSESASARSALVTEAAGNSAPLTARARTRRTLVSSTAMPRAEGEGRDRAGRVVTDARQRDQVVVPGRHLTIVPVHDRRRRRVQPQRPARVAEPAPGPDCLTARRRGKGCRRRPGGHPALEDGEHPCHRSLLEHELGDHHRPRGGAGAAPGKVARVVGVPVEDRGAAGAFIVAPIKDDPRGCQ